jgi:hypothetical protein
MRGLATKRVVKDSRTEEIGHLEAIALRIEAVIAAVIAEETDEAAIAVETVVVAMDSGDAVAAVAAAAVAAAVAVVAAVEVAVGGAVAVAAADAVATAAAIDAKTIC